MKRIALLILVMFLGGSGLMAQHKAKLKVGDIAPVLVPFKHIKGKPFMGFAKGKVYVVDFGATWCVPCRALIPHMTELAKKNPDVGFLGMFVWELVNKKDKNDLSYVKRVEKYVEDMGNEMAYDVAVDDWAGTIARDWVTAAGFAGVPVVFVVDQQGKIAWMGMGSGSSELGDVVEKVKAGTFDFSTSSAKKNEKIPYEIDRPLLIGGNGGNDTSFTYRSVIAPYKGELSYLAQFRYISGYRHADKFYRIDTATAEMLKSYQGRVQEIKASIGHLYYMAYADTLKNAPPEIWNVTNDFPDTIAIPEMGTSYGKYWPEPLVEVGDARPFEHSWDKPDNLYNYSLIVPRERGSAAFLQKTMRKDLDTYFGYDVSVENRMMPCWKLQPIEKGKFNFKILEGEKKPKKSERKGDGWLNQNASMMDLVRLMTFNWSSHTRGPDLSESAPFVDDTGISSKIEYFVASKDFNGIHREKNWDKAMDFFRRLGLKWVKSEKMMKVVVIRDPK